MPENVQLQAKQVFSSMFSDFSPQPDIPGDFKSQLEATMYAVAKEGSLVLPRCMHEVGVMNVAVNKLVSLSVPPSTSINNTDGL